MSTPPALPFPPRTLIAAALGAAFAISANLLSYFLIRGINEKVPQNERVSYLWWDSRIRSKYKELYPGSKLVFLLNLSAILMVASFLFVCWSSFH
jgi:hypothetical protein